MPFEDDSIQVQDGDFDFLTRVPENLDWRAANESIYAFMNSERGKTAMPVELVVRIRGALGMPMEGTGSTRAILSVMQDVERKYRVLDPELIFMALKEKKDELMAVSQVDPEE
jgi:hypothetical protein